jgi:hypothetical protein
MGSFGSKDQGSLSRLEVRFCLPSSDLVILRPILRVKGAPDSGAFSRSGSPITFTPKIIVGEPSKIMSRLRGELDSLRAGYSGP